jgi:dipeptidyl aminopeptidase/acylaminoacyl peptidase
VREEAVEFFSEGTRVVGQLRFPETAEGPLPAVVQGPGWLGLADAKAYVPWHTALTDAGVAVLGIDYRGHGKSEGERGWILPEQMVQDLINAVTYLETRSEIAADRIGAFGMGGIGAGNAIMAAAADPRIRAVAVQSVVADGALWLQRMRREYEWIEYRKRVADDARTWVRDGVSELVDPRTEIMIAAPERAQYSGKKDVDSRIEPKFHLQSAAALMRYRPIDVVDRIAPRALLLISVADDVVTPDDHAAALFERAGSPKRYVRQHGTTHYESYTKNFDLISGEIVRWLTRYLAPMTAEAFEDSP